MRNNEKNIKIEELKKQMEVGDYKKAQKILDTMDTGKIKILSDLGFIAEVYTQNERYDEAMQILFSIYDKTNTRKALYQLVWISIKRGNIEEAEKYLKEFEKAAPRDFYKYIFRYKIDKMKKESYEVLIETLEILKKTEYMEQWAYELAKIYYKAGNEEKCTRECTDIILWFGEGIYVEKAKLLKSFYSGETDKTKIIEELKRRAQEVKVKYNEATEESNVVDIKEDEIYTLKEFETESENQTEAIIKEVPEEIMEKDIAEMIKKDTAEQTEDITEKVTVEKTEDITEKDTADGDFTYQVTPVPDHENDELQRLSEEIGVNLEQIFYHFLHVESLKNQIIKSVENIFDSNTKSIQMIITGTSKSGKTTLAKDFSTFLYKAGKLKSSKVAKISANKLNTIDLFAKKDSLKDCCLLIENASELKSTTIEQILGLIQYFEGDIAVILEEDEKKMSGLLREYPKLMDLFTNRIHL